MFYYQVDLVEVIQGRGPAPRLVIELVARLPDDSLTAALMGGGRQFFGWGLDRYMVAELYDAINAQTRVTGNWAKKPPKIKPFPRPDKKKPTKADAALAKKGKKVSVADLYRRMTGGK
jgi:hypothetical protein